MAIRRLGLDLGSTHVRLAEVEFANKNAIATGMGVLTGFAEVPLPFGAVQAGAVADVGADIGSLMVAADAALTEAKRVGRNRCRAYRASSTMHDRMVDDWLKAG